MIGLQFRVTSAITGDPVIVAFTGIGRPSENRKTGPMIQMWMLTASHEPHIASKLGLDDAICGECPLRHHLGGGCYVRLHDAPLTVYRTALRGAYPTLELDNPEHIDALRSRPLRIGAYGDPAAIPYQPWMELMQSIAPTAWTGYTHQWRKPQSRTIRAMAPWALMVGCAVGVLPTRHEAPPPARARSPPDPPPRPCGKRGAV